MNIHPFARRVIGPLGAAMLLARCLGPAPRADSPALTPTTSAAAVGPTTSAAPITSPTEPTLAPTPVVPPEPTDTPVAPAATEAPAAPVTTPATTVVPAAPPTSAAPVIPIIPVTPAARAVPATPTLLAPPTALAATGALPAGATRFQVVPNQSKATFRVREQLARLQFPTDAVGSTGKVTGQFVVNPDGTFVADQSKITVDVSDLRTDDQLRDGFIKRMTLQTQRFPTAQFIPTGATGLPSPLPTTGEYSFQVTGKMTVHGVQRDATWDVTAKREGQSVTGTATTKFQFGDFGMQLPQVPVVLSIVDEIRLEVQLVVNQA